MKEKQMKDSVKVTTEKIVTEEEIVTINMSPAHATALVDILCQVGGSNTGTARGKIDDILHVLERAGYDVHDYKYRKHHMEGTIYFLDALNES